jgi:hypothetical protein
MTSWTIGPRAQRPFFNFMFYKNIYRESDVQRFRNWFDHAHQPWTLPPQTPIMQDNR